MKAFSEDGHGLDFTLKTAAAAKVTTVEKTLLEHYGRIVVGIAVILGLAPELGSRTLVLGEDHRLLYDGPIEPFLADTDKLLAANLAHVHRHRHGGLEHRHWHTHDWS